MAIAELLTGAGFAGGAGVCPALGTAAASDTATVTRHLFASDWSIGLAPFPPDP